MSYKRISPMPVIEGGTNASSFATTDGTVYYDGTRLVTTATGTTGQVLTSAGAGVAPSYQDAPLANTGWVLIQKLSASNTASLSFTSGITNTYNNYVLIVDSYNPIVSGSSLILTLSIDGGATYITTNYSSGSSFFNYFAPAVANTVGTTSSFVLLPTCAPNSTFASAGTFFLNNLTSGATAPMMTGTIFNYNTTAATYATGTSGGANTGGPYVVNALKVMSDSGNMDTGNFTLYGIVG